MDPIFKMERIPPHDTISSIVVRGVNWVGDTIMSLPAWKELRKIFPDANITAWVPNGLAPLLILAGVADRVITFDSSMGNSMKRVMKMPGILRPEGFQMAVLFQNAFESALTAYLARIPIRVGFCTDLRGPLLNAPIQIPTDIRSRHEVFYYLEITRQLESLVHGRSQSAPLPPDCSIDPASESLCGGEPALIENGLDLGKPVYAFCPGSVNSEAKRWPKDLWARLAHMVIGDLGGQVIFLGATHEEPLIEEIISQCPNGPVNLAGGTDITESLRIMRCCSMVISNDTGSAHLAVAANTPVLTIFGPTIPGATAPYGEKTRIIQGRAHCSPCRHYMCPVPGHPCMRSVTPESVMEKIAGPHTTNPAHGADRADFPLAGSSP